MPTFTPPRVQNVPRFLPTSAPQQKALFKFYQPYSAYVEVFWLSDGTFVQNYPTPENSNTNIPYPWNPNDPSGPFAWGYYVNFDVNPPVQTYFETSHEVWIKQMWDRPSYVDPGVALLLSNAGYADYITEN